MGVLLLLVLLVRKLAAQLQGPTRQQAQRKRERSRSLRGLEYALSLGGADSSELLPARGMG